MQVNLPDMDRLGYQSVQQDLSYSMSWQHCIIWYNLYNMRTYTYTEDYCITEYASCGATDGRCWWGPYKQSHSFRDRCAVRGCVVGWNRPNQQITSQQVVLNMARLNLTSSSWVVHTLSSPKTSKTQFKTPLQVLHQVRTTIKSNQIYISKPRPNES